MIDYPPLDTSAPTFPSEADLVHLMCRHIPYIEQYWVDEDEEHGYFGTLDVNEFQPPGGPINEMIIRSLGDELRGYAALHQSAFFDPTLAGIEKPVLLDPHADGRIRQSIAIIALEDGETSLVIDWTVSDVALSLNEGFGVYIMNDFVNGNRVSISFEGGRRAIRGVGGRARVIETGSTWIKIAGCLGIETSGKQLLYEDAAERNTPERWRNLLQDRVFLRPEVNGGTVRDYACVIRQGRAGTRRIGHGVERLQTAQDGVRAYRFRSRTSDVIAVANFTPVSRSVELTGRSIDVPAMDTVLIKEG